MDTLVKQLDNIKPMAESIVYIAGESKRLSTLVSDLENQIGQQQSILKNGEERLVEIEALCQQAISGANNAKADVVQAQSKIELMLAGAKADAARTVNNARNEATAVGIATTKSFQQEHSDLQSKIAGSKKALSSIEQLIEDRRADHAAVEASLASLRKRLGGV